MAEKELCKNCIHHGICKYEQRMVSLLESADILSFEYMLVLNNFLTSEVDHRIRCARWKLEEDK